MMFWLDNQKKNNFLVEMKKLKSYFLYSKEHRSGIFALILLIILLQIGIYFFNSTYFNSEKVEFTKKEMAWLNAQNEIDSLKQAATQQKLKIYPFNPNFITDYKGYTLGMSIQEIDRLHKFRESGKFVNSVKEFQNVTKVNDSLLNKISPYFKFPDWVNKTNKASDQNIHKFYDKKNEVVKPIDINVATKEQLMAVYGIGDKISDIILNEKEKFGAFATIEQLQYVWGVKPEVYLEIQKRFFATENTAIHKIKINEASTKELAQFPYFNYKIAKEIITYRSMNGKIKTVEDLTKINGFPVEKIQIIALYLEIN